MTEQIHLNKPYSEELISDEVQEVISYRPHWIIRKGNAFFLLILLLLLSLTWFIKYPDIVKGSARLVALNAPRLVSSKTEGKLMKLFVLNEQEVKEGRHLGYIESTAAYDEVMKLKEWIDTTINATKTNEYEILNNNPLPLFTDLGELQSGYQLFQNEFLQTRQTLASGYYQKKKNALEKDLQYLSTLKNNTYQQQKISTEEQKLLENEYQAYEKLAAEKVIAPLELNQYKSKLFAKEQSLKQTGSQITNIDISSHSKQKELLDLQKTVTDQQQQFHSSLLDLKSQVEKWIQQYVLVASENGKVLFVSSLQENEQITAGQGLFYIEPKQTAFYAEMMTGQKGFGKIKTGQKVIIRMFGYPETEFGLVEGIVSYISNIPNNRDSFLVKVDLPKGLVTNYNKPIFFRNGLSASAEVITDNRKLADRFWGRVMERVR
jgi:HlyD family secretion protein